MTNLLQRRTFSLKLLLICILPVLLITAILLYLTLRNSEAMLQELWMVIVAGALLIAGYAALAVFFVIGVRRRVQAVGQAIQQLSTGIFNDTLSINGNDEITAMASGVNTLGISLKGKTLFAEQIKAGNLDAQFDAGEGDQLSAALLTLKDNLLSIRNEEQKRNWANDGLTRFVGVLQSTKNMQELSHDIIRTLVQQLHANQGAIFVVDDATGGDHSVLEMQACYAFNRTKFLTQKIAVGEGLIGQAFLEKETVYLKDIPDHFIRITSGLGEANPRYVLIVPLKVNDTVVGVAELASFREFDKHEIEFIETIGENIAHTFLSFRTSERTTRLLHESQQHAENMRSQEEELRQNQEELQATQEEISRKYNALFKQLTELNYQSKFEQLKSITSTKKRNIEYYFGIIRSQIITFAENPLVIQGVLDFSKTFHTIAAEAGDSDVREMQASITKYYRTEFVPRLQDNSDVVSDLETFLPADNRTLALQYNYLSNNPHPTGKKSLLTQSPDGSDYSRVHSKYHTALLSFQEKFGYYDIFLIDAKTGDMLYSVFKEVDFGTNLLTGHYSQTNFGRLVKEAIDSKDPAFVKLVDFESYEPSYLAPASFIACPVYHENEKIGILVFQMPIHKINQILTGDHKWIEDGLGESGETCMVGSDYKVRSITRELIVNKRKHLQTLKRIGYADHVIRQIDKMDTNILLEELKADSVRRALHGEVGAQIEKSAVGADMLTAFAPVEIADVKWVILSMMKEEEASMRINNLRSSQ